MAITRVTKVGADVLMSALGWRQSSTVLESVGEERRLVTPWSSGAVSLQRAARTSHHPRPALGAFLVRAASKPSWNSAVQDITHVCEVSLSIFYNIHHQHLLPVETVQFSVESIVLSMVKHCQTWLTGLQEILSVTGLCNSIQLHISLSGYLLHLATQLRISLSMVPSFSI